MSRLRTLGLVAGLAAGFLLLYLVAGAMSVAPSTEPDHTSLNPNRWGTLALWEVASRLGLPTERLARSYTRGFLAPDETLALLDPQMALTKEEYQALWQCVAKGATVVLAASGEPRALPRTLLGTKEGEIWNPRATTALTLAYLGLRLRPAGTPGRVPVSPAQRRGALAEVAAVFVPSSYRLYYEPQAAELRRRLETVLGKQALPSRLTTTAPEVLVADAGGPVLARVTYGRGHVFVLAEAEMLSNEHLGQADNAVLALRLLTANGTPRRVLFDEYHHGIITPTALPSAINAGAFWAALWLALAALALYTVGFAWRFGRPRPPAEPPRRSALEYVEAFAALYREARAGGLMIRLIGDDFRRRLAGRLRLATRATDLELVQAAHERGLPADRLQALLAQLAATDPEARLPEPAVLRFTREVSDLEEALRKNG
ncbi:MAG TPA: DUF4350 domain-containing protein [Armatimonadota bacterium]|jgi:hypothetical protein